MQFSDPFVRRVALAKGIGFAIGLVAFFLIRSQLPDAPETLAWAVLGLFLTIGAFTGAVGYYDSIPLLGWPLPPLMRGGLIGLWLALVALLFGWQTLGPAFDGFLGLPSVLSHPLWMLGDGFICGAAIDMIVSAIYGRKQFPRND